MTDGPFPFADCPVVDCHVHVFDPQRFPYRADVAYQPVAAETATAQQLDQVLDAHGVRHALLVQPNSGYGPDNACLLDAIARSGGRHKGVAIVATDASPDELQALRAQGVVGAAFNVAMLGPEAVTPALLERLRDAGLWAQVQVQGDQLAALRPLLEDSGARLLVDHCGRPDPAGGVGQPGFQALLAMAANGRTAVKLSSLVKCSAQAFPHADAWPFAQALVEAFAPDALVWASDWPFLRAPARIDYAPLLRLARRLLPDAATRRAVLWDTPRRLFGFA